MLACVPTCMSSFEIFKEKVTTPKDWEYQRSWKRHLPDCSWLLILRGNWFWVLWFLIMPLLLNLYEYILIPRGLAPNWLTDESNTAYLYQPFSLTAFALALLITFRTNSCYARYWEARTIWGRIVNSTRNLSRQEDEVGTTFKDGAQALGYILNGSKVYEKIRLSCTWTCSWSMKSVAWFSREDEAALDQFQRWVQALGYIVKGHLRQGKGLQEDLKGVLAQQEIELLMSWGFRPSCAGQVLSDIVQRAGLTGEQQRSMDALISNYIDDAGACDRIQKTCVPQSYTRHTSRFLMLWLTFLPLTLYQVMGWAAIIAEAVIAFLFLGIDNIGTQIEEPFHVLPMDSYCIMMAASAKEQYQRSSSNLAAMLRAQIECSNLNKSSMADLSANEGVHRRNADGLRQEYSSLPPVDSATALGNEVAQKPSSLGNPSQKNAHHGRSMV